MSDGNWQDRHGDFWPNKRAQPVAPQQSEGQPLDPREWLLSGGSGHEDGEDGIRAGRWSGEGLIYVLEAYRDYLNKRPFAYACPANCGCIWRDNGDGTGSLFGPNSKSCQVCEPLPFDKMRPLYDR